MRKIKREVDLSKLVYYKNDSKKINWCECIGNTVVVIYGSRKCEFTILEYIKDSQKVKVDFEGNEHVVHTSVLTNGNIGSVLGSFVKEYRYSNGQIVKTKNKICKIIELYRNKKGRKSYICECQDCFSKKSYEENMLIERGFSCNICSDKISYPERLFGSIISKIEEDYVYQASFDWSKNINTPIDEGLVNKFYDFYIPSKNIIIEIHGEIHYKKGRWSRSRSLKYIVENDNFKKELALSNGISNYITINCELSEINYIKNSIINSELANIYNLNNIDWNKCNLEAYTSLMRICCNMWNGGITSTTKIATKLGISKNTVITYLKKFNDLGMCNYNPKKEQSNGANYSNKLREKTLICIETQDVFLCAKECADYMSNAYKDSIDRYGITKACNGNRKSYKGWHFKYIKDLTEEEYINYNIKDKLNNKETAEM